MEDPALAPPVQDTLPVTGWEDTHAPTLDGAPLPLWRYEISRSLAIHPDGARFVLGADWSLRAFDDAGGELWRRDVPGAAWAVNVSGDGRYVVAAYGDGTIRWHRMEDGAELLAFFPFDDGRNWVAWEPDGRFAATPGAMGALRWHVNRGWDEAALSLPARQVPNSFRPEVIKRVLRDGDTMQAVYAAEESERRAAIKRLTGAAFAPGALLHVLTIGVSDYGATVPPALHLQWADDDARDLHAALSAQSDDLWPYQRGFSMMLRDDEATKLNILTQLDRIAERVKLAPTTTDLVVIHFSGHGTVTGTGPAREFYLLPYGADIESRARIEQSGLSGRALRGRVAEIAGHARVLLLLDACRSGAVGELDADLLRTSLAGSNVTVLTSSSAGQSSWEREPWRNGAFTEVLLEALGRVGDANGNGLISIEEFTGYVTDQVRALTAGEQTPNVETRFTGDIFATRM